MRRLEARVSGHLDTYVGERDDRAVGAARRARHAADRLAVVHELRVERRKLVELEHAQTAVRMPAVMQPRHRPLPRVAALAEADVGPVKARPGGGGPGAP